jgi:HicB-like antitoxin of HicAB toxin-antitoxin system
MSKARDALAQGVLELYEANRVMPEPTPFEKIKIPKDCQLVTHFAVGAEPPDPSERVNIYLPKSLLERIDRRAAELGMSRSASSVLPRIGRLARSHRRLGPDQSFRRRWDTHLGGPLSSRTGNGTKVGRKSEKLDPGWRRP